MNGPWEVIITVAVLASFFLFPVGIFLSVARLDRDTDQRFHLFKLRSRPFIRLKERRGHLDLRPIAIDSFWLRT